MTFAGLALTLLIGLWRLSQTLQGLIDNCSSYVCYGIPAVLAVTGLWVAYRCVNWPVFADFLIAVEAEINKVSWPSWNEMWRWTIVVIVMIFAIGMLLFGFDAFWVWCFKLIGVLPRATPS